MSDTATQVNAPISDKQQFDLFSRNYTPQMAFERFKVESGLVESSLLTKKPQ